MDLRNNDDVKAFGVANSYGVQYNDILLKWLREYYGVAYSTLPDLLHRFVVTDGNGYIRPDGSGLLAETSDFLITEDNNHIILE